MPNQNEQSKWSGNVAIGRGSRYEYAPRLVVSDLLLESLGATILRAVYVVRVNC